MPMLFLRNVAEKKTNVYFRKIPDCFESARKHLLHFSVYGFWISVWLPTPFTIASFSWWAMVFFYYRKFQLMGPGILLRSQESAEGPGIFFGTPTLCEPANSYTVFMNKSKKAILHLSNLTILHFSNLKGDSVYIFAILLMLRKFNILAFWPRTRVYITGIGKRPDFTF